MSMNESVITRNRRKNAIDAPTTSMLLWNLFIQWLVDRSCNVAPAPRRDDKRRITYPSHQAQQTAIARYVR